VGAGVESGFGKRSWREIAMSVVIQGMKILTTSKSRHENDQL
jgi:hypothetical protein